MDEIDCATPIKLHVKGDDIGIATPSGGLIFNPFHKEFISRVGQVTFSPGIFYNASPMDNKSDSCKSTPNRLSLPLVLSPETQGLLFPADIDENPILQLKLQEKLDTQCDDDVQNSIHSFFKSHLIAPSPDTVDGSVTKFHRCSLPRTSSLLPTATPKTRKKSMCPAPSAPMSSRSVGSQTALTIPPQCDFEALLKQMIPELSPSRYAKPCDRVDDENSTDYDTSSHDPNLPHFYLTTPDKGDQLDPNNSDVANEVDGAHEIADEDTYASSGGFLCTSCHRPHDPPPFSRRSLFSESSETMDDTVHNRFDDDFISQQTLMAGDTQDYQRNLLPGSAEMSSSVVDVLCPTGYHTQDVPEMPDKVTNSFVNEAAQLRLVQKADRLRATFSHEDVFNYDQSVFEDARASSPSPICGRYHHCGSPFPCESVEMTSMNMSHGELSFRHNLRDGTSPPTMHINMSFQSPNLSPILPTPLPVQSLSRILPDDKDQNDRDAECDGSFRLPTPAARLFVSPSRSVSPSCPVPVLDQLPGERVETTG